MEYNMELTPAEKKDLYDIFCITSTMRKLYLKLASCEIKYGNKSEIYKQILELIKDTKIKENQVYQQIFNNNYNTTLFLQRFRANYPINKNDDLEFVNGDDLNHKRILENIIRLLPKNNHKRCEHIFNNSNYEKLYELERSFSNADIENTDVFAEGYDIIRVKRKQLYLFFFNYLLRKNKNEHEMIKSFINQKYRIIFTNNELEYCFFINDNMIETIEQETDFCLLTSHFPKKCYEKTRDEYILNNIKKQIMFLFNEKEEQLSRKNDKIIANLFEPNFVEKMRLLYIEFLSTTIKNESIEDFCLEKIIAIEEEKTSNESTSVFEKVLEICEKTQKK